MSAGYGFDTWCADSLSPGRYARGAMLVKQAMYHRLITPAGTLQPLDDTLGGDEEGTYGLDVAGYVGAVGYPTALQALPALVRGQLLKDDRVMPTLEVVATMTQTDDGLEAINLAIAADLADESGSFDLTLVVSNLTVSILGGLSQ